MICRQENNIDNIKDDNNKENKDVLISLAPTSSANNIEQYKEYIDFALNEAEENNTSKLKNKNIAITGGYGAGKSSIIKTYFKNNNNVLYVSLGNYIESKNTQSYEETKEDFTSKIISSTNNSEVNKKEERIIFKNTNTDDIIEISILQQILYSVRPREIPFSRFNRIDKCNNKDEFYKKCLKCSFSIFIVLILLLFIFKSDSLILLLNIKNIFLLLCVLIIIYSIVSYIDRRFHIGKIGFDKIELSKNGIDESILNKYLDELIHFFLFNDFDIIVFEDLDRFENNVIIFSKLKEINAILNSSINNKTIRFIYAIGDDLFDDSEKRTKFFDIIIPIVPYTGIRSSAKIFIDLNNHYQLGIDNDSIYNVSSFTSGARIVYDIINEYIIYSNNYKRRINHDIIFEDKKQLFYLLTYKVLYPKKFNSFFQGKNDLYKTIDYIFTHDENYDTYKDSELKKKKLDKDIEEYQNKFNQLIKKMDEIQKEYNDGIEINDDRYYKLYSSNGKEIDIFWINLKKDYKSLFSNDNYILKNNNKEILDCFKDIFTDEIKNDYVNYLCVFRERNNEKHRNFNISNSYILSKLNKERIVNYNNSDNFDNNTDDKNVNNIIHLNKFEEEIIKQDIIKNNYRSLLINSIDDLSYEDEMFLLKIKSSEPLEYEYKINNIEGISQKIAIGDFLYNGICNFQLFEYIKNSDRATDYLDIFFNDFNEYKYTFITKLLNNLDNIIKYNPYYLDNVWNYIDNYVSSDDDIYFYVYISILYSSKRNYPRNHQLFTYVSNCEKLDDYLNDKIDSIKNELIRLKLDFNEECEYNCRNTRFLSFIYENNLFKNNLNLAKAILKMKKIGFNDKKFISAIYYNKEIISVIYNHVFNNFESVLREYISQGYEFDDKEKFIRDFLNDNTMIEKNKFFLLTKVNKKITELSLIPETFTESCLDSKLVAPNWNNVMYLFKYEKYKEQTFYIIKDNIDILIKQEFNKKNELTDILFNKLGLGDDEVNNKLIENNYLCSDDLNIIRSIKENQNIPKDNYLKFLLNSFELIEKKKYDSMTSDILYDLTHIQFDKKRILNYLLNYKDIFDISLKERIAMMIYTDELLISNENILYIAKELDEGLYISLFNYCYKQFKDLISILQVNSLGVKLINKELFELEKNEKNLEFMKNISGSIIDHYERRGKKLIARYRSNKKLKERENN